MNETQNNKKRYILSLITIGSLIASFIGSILLPTNNKGTLLIKILIALLSLLGILLITSLVSKIMKNTTVKQQNNNPFVIEERTISIGAKPNPKKRKELNAELEYFVTKYQLNQ